MFKRAHLHPGKITSPGELTEPGDEKGAISCFMWRVNAVSRFKTSNWEEARGLTPPFFSSEPHSVAAVQVFESGDGHPEFMEVLAYKCSSIEI